MMNTTTLLAIFGTLITAALLVLTYYLVGVLKSLTLAIQEGEKLIEEIKPEIHNILTDVTDSTAGVRQVVVKVTGVVDNFISIPEIAKTFARHTLSALFSKEKRGN